MTDQWLCGKCGKRFGVNDVVQVTGGDSRPHHSDCEDPRREREVSESDAEFTDRVIGEARAKQEARVSWPFCHECLAGVEHTHAWGGHVPAQPGHVERQEAAARAELTERVRDEIERCDDESIDLDTTAARVVDVFVEFLRDPLSVRPESPGGELDDRPIYVLAVRAQALDAVQELIAPGDGPWVDPPMPSPELWAAIVEAAFPPPPMAMPEGPWVSWGGDGVGP